MITDAQSSSEPNLTEAAPLLPQSEKDEEDLKQIATTLMKHLYSDLDPEHLDPEHLDPEHLDPGHQPVSSSQSLYEKFCTLNYVQRAFFGTFFLLKLLSCLYQFVVISQTIQLAADLSFIDEANAENLPLTADLAALFFLILDIIVTAINNCKGLIDIASTLHLPAMEDISKKFFELSSDFFTLEGEDLKQKASTLAYKLTTIASSIGVGYKANVGAFLVFKRFLPYTNLTPNQVVIISNIIGVSTGIASCINFQGFQANVALKNRKTKQMLSQCEKWKKYKKRYPLWFLWVNFEALLLGCVSSAVQGMSIFFVNGDFKITVSSTIVFASLSLPNALFNFLWLSSPTYQFNKIIESYLKNPSVTPNDDTQEKKSPCSHRLEVSFGAINSIGTGIGFFEVVMRAMLIANAHTRLSQEPMTLTIPGSLTSFIMIMMLAKRDYTLKVKRHHTQDQIKAFFSAKNCTRAADGINATVDLASSEVGTNNSY